jgi:2-hydroxychromene-2-carboxylate isomerase
MWVKQKNIENIDTLKECLGFMKSKMVNEIISKAIINSMLDILRVKTQQAFDSGIFGVPTVTLDDELFYGADRYEQLMWRINS